MVGKGFFPEYGNFVLFRSFALDLFCLQNHALAYVVMCLLIFRLQLVLLSTWDLVFISKLFGFVSEQVTSCIEFLLNHLIRCHHSAWTNNGLWVFIHFPLLNIQKLVNTQLYVCLSPTATIWSSFVCTNLWKVSQDICFLWHTVQNNYRILFGKHDCFSRRRDALGWSFSGLDSLFFFFFCFALMFLD